MKLKVASIVLGFLTLLNVHTFSQLNNLKLDVGDKLPDITIGNVRNYSSSSIKTAGLRGKLVIIDFWNKYCTSCINAFPKMQKLQDKFKDKIQILLVTSNSDGDLKPLLEISPIMKNLTLPYVTSDKVLHDFFPHSIVPYHVWISEKGEVKYTSSGWNTTEENIAAFLAGKQLDIVNRNDLEKATLKGLSLLQQYKESYIDYGSEVESYSLLTKGSRTTGQTSWKFFVNDADGDPDFSTALLTNNSIIGLFRFAHISDRNLLHIKTIVEVKKAENLSKYYSPFKKGTIEYKKWFQENRYCYEVKIWPGTHKKISAELGKEKRNYMQKDLGLKFNLSSALEFRNIKCYVLRRLPGTNIVAAKSGLELYEKTTDSTYTIRNQPIAFIKQVIEDRFAGFNTAEEIPVIDETNYADKLDATITVRKDLSSWNQELSKIGLQLIEEIRNVECLVLKEL